MVNEAAKWYKKLGFPVEYDEEFYKTVERVKNISVPNHKPVEYLSEKNDLGLNLIYFLSQCGNMEMNFNDRLIPKKYFVATVDEIKRSGLNCIKNFGCLGVYEINWISKIIKKDSVFRIERLNFEISNADEWDCVESMDYDEKVISIHIPPGDSLNIQECLESMECAKRFFDKYFPEFKFKCFVCRSWLLYEGLDKFLNSHSNIRRFRNLFEIKDKIEGDDAIKFVFSKAATRENISDFNAQTSLQRKMKAHILNEGKLYVGIGKRDF